MKVILASTSPRRKELLEREGIDFIIDASSITEYLDSSLEIEERLKKLAYDKGISIHEKYPDDVAVVWIDAHPDLNLPGDSYTGYHAMALTACFGMGDKEIVDLFPAKLNPSKSIIVGLRAWNDTNASKERQEEIGVESLSPAHVAQNSTAVLDWLKTTGASKVVIHFDLDALDPAEIIAAVGTDPDGLKIETVVRVINDIAKEYDVVGLTIAEPMPRVAIKIKNMLNQMPLLKE